MDNLTVQRGGIKLIAKTAISFEIKTDLIFILRDEENENYGYTARSYISSLKNGLLSIQQTGQSSWQDNAHMHIVNMTEQWHEKHGIWVINLPPCGSDINHIEHIWKILKHELY